MKGSPLHVPEGFLFSAATAGLKQSGAMDLALAEAPLGAAAAALFTRNRVAAAPVIAGRTHLRRTLGRVRSVIINSGNANCATGRAGQAATLEVCRSLGSLLEAAPEFIFPCSTGIIGVPLPVEKIRAAMTALVQARAAGVEAAQGFARAIMTTDTRPKLASVSFSVGKKRVTVMGVAKGAGMIHPDLATMLAYVFTDIEATPAQLRTVLKQACDSSFNAISIDGDTSTNDTVLLLASGASGLGLNRRAQRAFANAVDVVCRSLAEQIVADGEGVRHVVRLIVEGARSRNDARRIGRAISTSLLVKTALAGADPNWGRILAAAGRSGVRINVADVDVWIGEQQVCSRGGASPFDRLSAHNTMRAPAYSIRVRVGRGRHRMEILTSDLTAEYVRINADYST